jgi:hypothetical protein
MRVILPILANLFLVVAALGFGGLFVRLIPKSFSDLDRFVLRFLAGFGFLGTALFCVGQVRFSRLVILGVLLLGAVIGFVFQARGMPVSWPPRNLRGSAIPAAIVFGVVLLTAVGGLAFPTGDLNNDSIAYHYLGPKVWLREGIIRPVPDEVTTYFPVVVETQYGALMAFGGARAPEFFSVVSLATILLVAASLAIRLHLDSTGAWWVAALIASMPAVYHGIYSGFLDALFASFLLAAARVAFDAERTAEYVLFGFFCGFAMGTKYTGILAFPVLVFCAVLIAVWARHRPAWLTLKSTAAACVAAIVIASPFYLRNWILYECPLYPPPPALLRFFPLTHPIPNVIQALVKEVRDTGGGMGRGVTAFFLLPLNVTYHTAVFRGAGGIGLVPLALGPFGVLAWRRGAFAKGLLLFAALESVFWFLTAQESRYAINIFVIAALFGVIGWRYVAGSVSRNARFLAAAAVGVSILYGLWMIFPERAEDVHAALSSSYEAKRWHAETGFADGFDFINEEPSVKKILILDAGVAPFFIDKPYVKPFGVWGERAVPGADTVPEVMAQLPALQVTHVFDRRPKGESFHLPDRPPGLALVFEREDQRIYRVN